MQTQSKALDSRGIILRRLQQGQDIQAPENFEEAPGHAFLQGAWRGCLRPT